MKSNILIVCMPTHKAMHNLYAAYLFTVMSRS